VVTDDGGMRRAPILRLTSVFGLALILAGCGSPTDSPGESDPASAPATTASGSPSLAPPTLTPGDGKPVRVTMTGTIEDGVESGCLVFTDEASDETYSIASDQLPGTAALDSRVTLTGTIDPDMMSFCMQGPILLVTEVTEATD